MAVAFALPASLLVASLVQSKEKTSGTQGSVIPAAQGKEDLVKLSLLESAAASQRRIKKLRLSVPFSTANPKT